MGWGGSELHPSAVHWDFSNVATVGAETVGPKMRNVFEDTLASTREWGSIMGTEPCVKLGGNLHSLWEGAMLLGTHNTGSRALLPYKELVNAVSQTQCQAPEERRSPYEHEQVSLGPFSLPYFIGVSEHAGYWSPFLEVTVISLSVSTWCAQAPVFSVNKNCCKTVRVLSGEKLSLLTLHHKEPCGDRAASWDRKCCRRDAAASAVEGRKDSAVSGTDPKGVNFGNGFPFSI